jgi:hypothetical protein
MEKENNQKRKTVRLTVNLDLLCDIWDTRTDPNQDLDSRIEELLLKGLKARQENSMPTKSPVMGKKATPK